MELHLLLPGIVLGCIRDIVLITIPKLPCTCLDRITRDLVSFSVAENWALGLGQSLGKHRTAGALELWWSAMFRWWKKTGSMALMEIHFRKVNIVRICWFKTSKYLLCQARGLQPMLEEIPSPWSLGCVEAIVGEETILFFMFNKIWYDDPEWL